MSWLTQVAVSDATLYYDKQYTYSVPPDLAGRIFIGSMVLVPFGFGRARPRIGVVMALEQGQPTAKTKAIYDAAPEEARLTEELLSIVRYLKQATFCTWFEAVRAVIPYGAQYKVVQQDGKWLLQKQMSRHTEIYYERVSPLPEPPKKLSTKQQSVLEALRNGAISRDVLTEQCGVTRAVPDTLVKYGLLQTVEKDRLLPAMQEELPLEPPLTLSPEQMDVCSALKHEMIQEKPHPALLYGVTGSGKTPVFLELIRAALQAGRTALILVPEIGLTPQMIDRLRGAFGRQVAVQHSALSNTERLLQWRQIQRGETQVVVGTRSAVFAPLENIGLIVVDEEQERTYQSESAPRYDAIEVARRRASYHGALLLLASATPAISDYYYAQTGRYRLFKLENRYAGLPLPAVEMVDMRQELAEGHTGIFSRRLAQEAARTIAQGRQVILLLNRRGYNRVGVCRSCGETLKCGDCSVPMVYHKAEDRLLCHYCGKAVVPAPTMCPLCGGEMRYTGFGTQRAEEELENLFPHARILRMDMDSTGKKGAHEEMLRQFGTGEYDILIGTQMVAKGLDFEKVSLVGVVGIDSLLFGQGYRAYETVFSLVTQVVGRSGRSQQPGQAIIQTSDPQNPVLVLAAAQDYDAFYKQEIGFRKLALYPPFCTICMVGFVAEDEAETIAAARYFRDMLTDKAKEAPNVPLRVLGPAPMPVVQVAGSYRYRLTLKCRNDAAFRALLEETVHIYGKAGWARKVSVFIDFHTDAT